MKTEKVKIYYNPEYGSWSDDGDAGENKEYNALYAEVGDNKYMYIIKNIVIFAFYNEEKDTIEYDYSYVSDLLFTIKNNKLYKKFYNGKFTIKQKRKLINFLQNYRNIIEVLNIKKIKIEDILN